MSHHREAATTTGSNLTLRVQDSTGGLGYSGDFTVVDGDDSCMPVHLWDPSGNKATERIMTLGDTSAARSL